MVNKHYNNQEEEEDDYEFYQQKQDENTLNLSLEDVSKKIIVISTSFDICPI